MGTRLIYQGRDTGKLGLFRQLACTRKENSVSGPFLEWFQCWYKQTVGDHVILYASPN